MLLSDGKEIDMVSIGQMTALIIAIVLPILIGAVPYYIFWKRSSKIETGMLGALGYGIVGYLWEEIIYSFLGLLALTNLTGLLNATGGNAFFVAVVEALISGAFVALGMYWGIYLTNTKQRSIYRSATVGIGFGIGYTLLNYGFQMYYVVKINTGTYTGDAAAKDRILSTSPASLYVSSYRNVLMVLIFMGMAFLAGKYYLEKKRLVCFMVPLLAYVFIRFTDVILNAYLPQLAARIIVCILLTALAVACLWFVRGEMQKPQN